jgi:hypothetical protein
MGIIPINFQSLNPNSAQGINTQSANATLPIASLPEGNLSAMGFNIVGNGTSQVVAADLSIVENPTATEILTGNLLENALGDNISIVSINIQSQSYSVGNLINLQGIGNLTINANGDYNLLVNNINFSGALPNIDFTIANSNQSDNATFSVFIDRLSTGGAFQANDDYVAISQGTNTTGNLLDNDNGDNLFIESFILSSLPGVTFLSGETAQIQIYQQNNYLNVASIKIMANGDYYLTALNSFFNGNLPLITYLLRNNLGASDTAKLNIAINTNINPPVLPPSNSVNIPSSTPIPLPIPIVQPPTPEPLPILQALTLTLNEDEEISYNLLNNSFPNIQVDIFSVNGQNFATGANHQSINGIGFIKILPNGILNFYGNPNYNGFVPTVWFRITNGFETASYSIDFIINSVFTIEDDPFISSVSYWANGQGDFIDMTAPIVGTTTYNNFSLGGNYDQNEINSKYANLSAFNQSIHIIGSGLMANIMTWEGFFKLTDNLQNPLFQVYSGTGYGQNPSTIWIKLDTGKILVVSEFGFDQVTANLTNWFHLAVVINDLPSQTIAKVFLNGVLVITSDGYNYDSGSGSQKSLRIGQVNCYCSHLRITKAERYTQNFNPLTESYLF